MIRYSCAVAATFLVATAAAFGGAALYPSNQPPLRETPFVALPLGSVRAEGWLLKQLQLQRDGLTGHAEMALTELDGSSAWRGGDKENWEKSPYYVKGLIPLAYTLDDADLEQRAQKWIDWAIASQRADGFYGPAQNDDWWPRMVSNYFLRDYYEATADARVPTLLSNYYRYMLDELPHRPLKDWGKSRAGDEMDTAIWLYNRTREPFLLDLVDLLRKQAYDWPTIMRENAFPSFGDDFQPKHNVNVPQAMKMPAVAWQRSGTEADRTAIDAGRAFLPRDHGLSIGMQSGTEFLAGRSPGQGVEFCSIVEQMLSDETVVRIFGEGKYADHLEQVAYNALPAAWNRDLTALRYYTLPNQVIAKRGGQGFGQNYDNGIVYGPRSGFPCCCFNVHQGWPKLVQNSWVATTDGGLAAIVYAPNRVTAKVGDGAMATIVQKTDYPFDSEVRFSITVSAPATFPLALRTPAWCDGATLTVNGKAVDAAKPGGFAKIARQWKTGDEVVLTLPMKVRVERGVHDSASVHRGPLVYSLAMEADHHAVGQPAPGFDETEVTTNAPWNYALVLDAKRPDSGIELLVDDKPRSVVNPFRADNVPTKLTATARKVAGWGLAWNGVVAFDPPASPVATNAPNERVTLLPFGSQDLRLTDFPVYGAPTPAAMKRLSFAFDTNDLSAWSWFGGSWFIDDGHFKTHGNGGTPGYKALVERAIYNDVEVSADVMPPEGGDAGVMARVSKASIGADAYQGYYAGINAADNAVVLGKADGQIWTELGRASRPIRRDAPQRIRLSVVGMKLAVWVGDDRQPILRATDNTWTTGQVGVRMYSPERDKSAATFDNVEVLPAKDQPSNRRP